jgi:hypothetical protein
MKKEREIKKREKIETEFIFASSRNKKKKKKDAVLE